jgi:hypothetical protein
MMLAFYHSFLLLCILLWARLDGFGRFPKDFLVHYSGIDAGKLLRCLVLPPYGGFCLEDYGRELSFP